MYHVSTTPISCYCCCCFLIVTLSSVKQGKRFYFFIRDIRRRVNKMSKPLKGKQILRSLQVWRLAIELVSLGGVLGTHSRCNRLRIDCVERTYYGELAGSLQQKDSSAFQRLFFIALRSYSSSAYSVQQSILR